VTLGEDEDGNDKDVDEYEDGEGDCDDDVYHCDFDAVVTARMTVRVMIAVKMAMMTICDVS